MMLAIFEDMLLILVYELHNLTIYYRTEKYYTGKITKNMLKKMYVEYFPSAAPSSGKLSC